MSEVPDLTVGSAPGSLLVRTTLVLAGTLVVALLALVLFVKPFLGDAIERESSAALVEQGNRARKAARSNVDETEDLLRTATAAAWRASKETVSDAPVELLEGDAEAVRTFLIDEIDRLERASEKNRLHMMAEARERGVARLRQASAELETTSRERAADFSRNLALRAGALILGLLALVFLVHGLLLYRTVLAPVSRLSAATRDVAGGRLATRIPVQGDDEVARLAASFNAMTESLENALGDLTALNATLEDRVSEKTAALSSALGESRDANRRLESAMSELRAKERELRHAEKMASLGTLAGGIAHEFNNLLGGILGCAEDAAQEDDKAELLETLSVIERTARRGTGITQNLLKFARPAGGAPEEVDVGEVARDVAALVEPEATRTGVRVTVDAEGPTPLVADPSGLHQVLLNLATNALHAMCEAGGDLTIRVRSSEEDVRIDVVDTGVGIPREIRDRLFEPFFSTRGPEGTGLGLSVSYGIVQAHRGRLAVESEPGRGATFTVTLPHRGRESNTGRPT